MNAKTVGDVFRLDGRPTRAIVDLDAIAGNISAVRGLTGPGVAVMAVVKANAYGHGAVVVAQTAIETGAEQLGVATVDEAAQLRAAGIRAPILVLGPIDDSEIDRAIGHTIELSVGSLRFAELIAAAAERDEVSSPVALHLKVDTGMRRFGAVPGEAGEIARFVNNHALLRLRGISTHFARADDEDESPARRQSALLDELLGRLELEGIRPELVHVANSAGTLRNADFHRQMIRLGIAMYGLNPSSDVPIVPGMRPAMAIVSRIARVIELAPGDSVSYGGTYRAASSERAALVPIGYADGYDRGLSNLGEMYVHNVRSSIRGRVCMDQTVIGLPEGIDIAVGDPVVVAGAWENGDVPSFDELAGQLGTINYEIASSVAARVPRYYIRGGNVVAVSDLAGTRFLPSATSTNA